MQVLACFPAGRDDPDNRGRFVLKLSRSGINHNRVRVVSLLNAAYSLSTTTCIRGERFIETGHSAVTGTSNSGVVTGIILSSSLAISSPASHVDRKAIPVPLTAASRNASP